MTVIEREGASIALVLFPAVQYYTGQWFPMERITRAAKAQVRASVRTIIIARENERGGYEVHGASSHGIAPQ